MLSPTAGGFDREEGVVNGVSVGVEGLQPFCLKVYNETEISGLTDIDSYIALRKLTLAQLASADPNRQIEVSISPKEYVTVAAMWSLKAKYGLDIDELGVDWFDSTGKYAGAMHVADPKELDEQQQVDFNASASTVESQLRT